MDQFAVFVAIVDEGSFAAAARRINRAQSAVTYAIQKLEEQSQLVLFDRSTYRPTLTDAGRALLPRARRVPDDVGDYRLLARSLVEGLEAELSLVVDAFAPLAMIVDTLQSFHATFPTAMVRVSTEFLESAARTVFDGRADLAMTLELLPLMGGLERRLCGVVELVPVAAPHHPLAHVPAPIEPAMLRDHVQLVLSNRSSVRDGQDFGVHAVNRWHLTDLDIKHAMLRAGLGWGSLPRDRVARDLASGRLVELAPASWEGSDRMPRFPLVVVYRRDKPLGPAGRWLVDAFTSHVAHDGSA